MTTLELKKMGLQEINAEGLIETDGGFWQIAAAAAAGAALGGAAVAAGAVAGGVVAGAVIGAAAGYAYANK